MPSCTHERLIGAGLRHAGNGAFAMAATARENAAVLRPGDPDVDEILARPRIRLALRHRLHPKYGRRQLHVVPNGLTRS